MHRLHELIVVLPIIGPAIVGSGQCLAWTPCHKQPVRLQADEVKADLTTVYCSKGSCSARWEVAFKKIGVDWMALWWGP